MDPPKLAEFYCDVFGMEILERKGENGKKAVFLTDGYMNLALLSQKAEGKPNGLNHFGFQLDDDGVTERLKRWDVVGPEQRPPDRTYAETRATDPEGNNFDLNTSGYQTSRLAK
jgi:catechol 2,3-dioxygenase-like lactoylglutathione lyase family enzyme